MGRKSASYVAKDESEMQAKSAVLLTSAFSEFISASSRLENSYRQLQEEVSELRVALSARNAARALASRRTNVCGWICSRSWTRCLAGY